MKVSKYLVVLGCLLLMSGCATGDSKQVQDLLKKVETLEATIKTLTANQNEVNRYGNGVYYCQPPFYGIYSIQFLESNVIRVFGYDDDEKTVNRNNYYEVKETSTGEFELVKDVVLPDTVGIYDVARIRYNFDTNGNLLKAIKISPDHQTLVYGNDPTQHVCKFNEKYVFQPE